MVNPRDIVGERKKKKKKEKKKKEKKKKKKVFGVLRPVIRYSSLKAIPPGTEQLPGRVAEQRVT